MTMVTTMKPIKFRIGASQIVFDYIPLIFLVLMASFLGQVNSLTEKNADAVKLASDLNRQRTSAEMRALHAEREASRNDSGSFNVFVIQPDKRNASSPAYVDLNKPL